MIQFIRDIFDTARVTRRPVVSFEFFPTKTAEGERALLEKTIPALRQLNPAFCSVTYGAGGGTREKTLGSSTGFSGSRRSRPWRISPA